MNVSQYVFGREDGGGGYGQPHTSTGISFRPAWMMGDPRASDTGNDQPILEIQTDGVGKWAVIASRRVKQRIDDSGEARDVRPYAYSHYLLVDGAQQPQGMAMVRDSIPMLLESPLLSGVAAYQRISLGEVQLAYEEVMPVPVPEASLPKEEAAALAYCATRVWRACWQRYKGEEIEPVAILLTPVDRRDETVSDGVAFLKEKLFPMLPKQVRSIISVTIGAVLRFREYQKDSACRVFYDEPSVRKSGEVFDFVRRSIPAPEYAEDALLADKVQAKQTPIFFQGLLDTVRENEFLGQWELEALGADYDIAHMCCFMENLLVTDKSKLTLGGIKICERQIDVIHEILKTRHGLKDEQARAALVPVEVKLLERIIKDVELTEEIYNSLRARYEGCEDVVARVDTEKAKSLREQYERVLLRPFTINGETVPDMAAYIMEQSSEEMRGLEKRLLLDEMEKKTTRYGKGAFALRVKRYLSGILQETYMDVLRSEAKDNERGLERVLITCQQIAAQGKADGASFALLAALLPSEPRHMRTEDYEALAKCLRVERADDAGSALAVLNEKLVPLVVHEMGQSDLGEAVLGVTIAAELSDEMIDRAIEERLKSKTLKWASEKLPRLELICQYIKSRKNAPILDSAMDGMLGTFAQSTQYSVSDLTAYIKVCNTLDRVSEENCRRLVEMLGKTTSEPITQTCCEAILDFVQKGGNVENSLFATYKDRLQNEDLVRGGELENYLRLAKALRTKGVGCRDARAEVFACIQRFYLDSVLPDALFDKIVAYLIQGSLNGTKTVDDYWIQRLASEYYEAHPDGVDKPWLHAQLQKLLQIARDADVLDKVRDLPKCQQLIWEAESAELLKELRACPDITGMINLYKERPKMRRPELGKMLREDAQKEIDRVMEGHGNEVLDTLEALQNLWDHVAAAAEEDAVGAALREAIGAKGMDQIAAWLAQAAQVHNRGAVVRMGNWSDEAQKALPQQEARPGQRQLDWMVKCLETLEKWREEAHESPKDEGAVFAELASLVCAYRDGELCTIENTAALQKWLEKEAEACPPGSPVMHATALLAVLCKETDGSAVLWDRYFDKICLPAGAWQSDGGKWLQSAVAFGTVNMVCAALEGEAALDVVRQDLYAYLARHAAPSGKIRREMQRTHRHLFDRKRGFDSKEAERIGLSRGMILLLSGELQREMKEGQHV